MSVIIQGTSKTMLKIQIYLLYKKVKKILKFGNMIHVTMVYSSTSEILGFGTPADCSQ